MKKTIKTTQVEKKLGKYANLDEAIKAKNDLARAILKGVDLS